MECYCFRYYLVSQLYYICTFSFVKREDNYATHTSTKYAKSVIDDVIRPKILLHGWRKLSCLTILLNENFAFAFD